jgi:hypothetical protein
MGTGYVYSLMILQNFERLYMLLHFKDITKNYLNLINIISKVPLKILSVCSHFMLKITASL